LTGTRTVTRLPAPDEVRSGVLLQCHGRLGRLDVSGVMRIVGEARPVAGVFQLHEFCAHLRTGDGRAGFLSVSSDRKREGGYDGKDEMTSIHDNAPMGL
jgi:hypothetical protein